MEEDELELSLDDSECFVSCSVEDPDPAPCAVELEEDSCSVASECPAVSLDSSCFVVSPASVSVDSLCVSGAGVVT